MVVPGRHLGLLCHCEEALLYSTVLEIFVFSVKLQDISSVM